MPEWSDIKEEAVLTWIKPYGLINKIRKKASIIARKIPVLRNLGDNFKGFNTKIYIMVR